MEGKVASFMLILSSMHEALFLVPGDISPTENPEATTEAAQANTQTPEAAEWKQEERKDDNKDPACTTKAGEQWDYGVTHIEEEPWPGDLSATWPSYRPTV